MKSAQVTDRGLQYDRRWMLVNEQNRFLSQREIPKMTLLQVRLERYGLRVFMSGHPEENILVPYQPVEGSRERVTIWNDTCEAVRAGERTNKWFSRILGIQCKMVFMPDDSLRPVNTSSGQYPEGNITAFADAYPFLLLGESSMEDLNSRLEIPLSITRFRPNIVFSGGMPYQEDEMDDFLVNGIRFTPATKCARCMVPNVDQKTGETGKEPLKTLAKYRLQDKKIYFGRNMVHSGTGIIRAGDEIRLK